MPQFQLTKAYWGFKNVVKTPILMVFFLYHFSPTMGRPVASEIKDSIILNLREPTITCWPLKYCANAIATP